MFRTAALRGVAAGMAGVAVMTVAEKVEQRLTRRPNSYVPGRTLLASSPSARLSGRSRRCGTTPCTGALGHWGTGALLGGLRGIWAATGLRGPRANLVHTVVRLATDQTFENAVG